MAYHVVLAIQELGLDAKTLRVILPGYRLIQAHPKTISPILRNRVLAIITDDARVDREVLALVPNTRIVSVASTGHDAVDLMYCRGRGIAVCNIAGYSTNAVAEFTLGLTISLLRHISHANSAMNRGLWDQHAVGTELSERIVGIVGTGSIGIRAAELYSAFGCRLMGWSRSERSEFARIGGEYVSLRKLMSAADVVSLHLPLNEATRGIISDELLSSMKVSAILINTSRGSVLDQSALIQALRSSKIRGAALDVFDSEPLPEQNELRGLQNAVLTPHIAYRSQEAVRRRVLVTLTNIRDYLNGRRVNRID